jgi:hypothetical protein
MLILEDGRSCIPSADHFQNLCISKNCGSLEILFSIHLYLRSRTWISTGNGVRTAAGTRIVR